MIPWRTERLPTLVLWPGEFHGLYSPQDRKESDTTERLSLSLKIKQELAKERREKDILGKENLQVCESRRNKEGLERGLRRFKEARSEKHLFCPVVAFDIYPIGDGEPLEEAVYTAALQLPVLRCPSAKSDLKIMLERKWRKGNPLTLLVGM